MLFRSTSVLSNSCDGRVVANNGRNGVEKATGVHKSHIMACISGFLTQEPRRRAVFCGIIFAVSIVILSVFAAVSVGQSVGGEDGYSGEGVLEANVIFESVTRSDGAIFLEADGGAEVYAIFGYALQNGELERLLDAVDGERSFKARYIVMDRDQWNGYYGLVSVADGEGNSYLDEAAMLTAREGARTEKLVILATVTALCGVAFGFYLILSVCERQSMIKRKK